MANNKFRSDDAMARCVPMSSLQAVLSGKWKILILWYIAFYKVQRFGELLRRLDGITQSTLTKQLRELEMDLRSLGGIGVFRSTPSFGLGQGQNSFLIQSMCIQLWEELLYKFPDE